MAVELRAFSWDRMIEAVHAVRDRALRATRALENAGIPYAMAGGNAVAAWVARVDRAAVRNTQDVDLLVRRSDLPAITTALESAGFVSADDYTIVTLEALVRMKLNSFRDKDRTHLRDFLSLGLIDASWLPRLVPEHAARLQQLIDDPDG